MTSSMPSHAGSIGGLSAVQRNFARQEKEYEIEAHPPASGVLYFRPWTNNMLTFSFWTFWHRYPTKEFVIPLILGQNAGIVSEKLVFFEPSLSLVEKPSSRLSGHDGVAVAIT